MPAAPVIRNATLADEQALGELDRRCWSTSHSVQPRPAPPYPPFFDRTHLPGHYLVAEAADLGVVGFLRFVRPSELPCNAHVRQIQGLLVDPAARRRGVARALLDAALRRARREGARRLTLRVLGHNTPARTLYEAAGFTVEGVLREEFLLDGRYVDDVMMVHRLDGPE